MLGNRLKRNRREVVGAIKSGGSIEAAVSVRINEGGRKRGGSVGADGGSGDSAERGGFFGVDLGRRVAGLLGSDVTERMTKAFVQRLGY